MPPRFAVSAPKCAKCDKSVYLAEQVIGPYGKPYHKPCLSCGVCGKRLDSTLLVEHDGLPFCRNCHKAHLGQGKGGFGLAVPLRPEVSVPPPKPAPLSSNTNRDSTEVARERQRQEDELNEQMSGINLSRRNEPEPAVRLGSRPPQSPAATAATKQASSSRPVTSIDDMVASGMEVPMPRGRNGDTSRNEIFNSLYGDGQGGQDASLLSGSAPRQQPDRWEKPGPPVQAPHSPLSKPSPAVDMPSTPKRETIGSIRMGADGLPTPSRKDPVALSRERERGVGGGHSGTAKTYSPRTKPQSSPSRSPRKGEEGEFDYLPASALNKMGLGSTINAAAVGTPLCARCERPVYFAEQKQAAGRKWHRGCLRCDGCSTTLESGKLEEGPPSAIFEYETNVWCRTCYAKRFGPKGIGVAGMSLPETMR